MYYHYPYTCGSAYVLWKRLISGRKAGILRIKIFEEKRIRRISDSRRQHHLRPLNCNIPGLILNASCRIGNLSLVKYMVLEQSVDPTKLNNWPIQLASRAGRLNIVKYLVACGCDPTDDNNLAIQWASHNGHKKVVKFLYSIGCEKPKNEKI